jgi:hypothetical protein
VKDGTPPEEIVVGLGDVLKGLFSRRDAPAESLVLLPGEVEVARAVGTWRTGTLASVDGYLVLTTERLLLASEASGGTVAVLAWSLHDPHPGGPARRPVAPAARPGAEDLLPRGALAAVGVAADSSLISPPSLVLVDTTGHRIEIGILANRLTPNLSRANSVARDGMVAAIRSAISAAAVRPRHPPPAQPDPFSWFTDGS